MVKHEQIYVHIVVTLSQYFTHTSSSALASMDTRMIMSKQFGGLSIFIS